MKGQFAEYDLPVIKQVLLNMLALPNTPMTLSALCRGTGAEYSNVERKQYDRIRKVMRSLVSLGYIVSETVDGARVYGYENSEVSRIQKLVDDPVTLASTVYNDMVPVSTLEDAADGEEPASAEPQPTQPQYDMAELGFRATMGLVERFEAVVASMEQMKGKQDTSNELLVEMGNSIKGIQDAVGLLADRVQKVVDEFRASNAVAGCAFKRATEVTAAHAVKSNGKKGP